MSLAHLIGRTFDGYSLLETVAGGDEEVLFLAERVRDGDRVWVRTARDRADLDGHERLRQRYQAERSAAQRLGSTGAVLPVRELIQVEGVPGLVTDVPKGRSLNDLLSARSTPERLGTVLDWYRKLMTAMEAAHEEDAAHGSLQGRAVYLTEGGRITICGVADMSGSGLAEARSSDVRSLAMLLYHASTARPPKRGFPDTGMPVAPQRIVEGYPTTLGRFLIKRLGDDVDTAVPDAGVFRRSIDALAVDPDFRKAAGISRDDDEPGAAPKPGDRESARQRFRRIAKVALIAGILVALSVLTTMMLMEHRIEDARREAQAPVARPAGETVVPAAVSAESPRMAVWRCLHEGAAKPSKGLAPRSIAGCLRLSPDITNAELRTEATRIAAALANPAEALDAASSADESYRRIFAEGADAVSRFVHYRLERDLPLDGLDAWLIAHKTPGTLAVLRTLAGRDGLVGSWSRRTLQPATDMP